MRTPLTSVLAAALAAGTLFATPAAARPVDGTQMRANAGTPEPQPSGGDGRQPKTWLIVIAGLAGATIAAGGSAGAHRGHRLA